MDLKYLYKMFPTQEKRTVFLSQCVLTFGLRLDSLSYLMNKSKEELYEELVTTTEKYYESVDRVFRFGMKRQDISINLFNNFYNRLVNAYKEKDREQISKVLHELSDKKAINILKREGNRKLSDEEILIILKYQIKYMLGVSQTASYFKIDRGLYAKRVRSLQDNYYDLVSDFDYLSDFYYKSNKRKIGV